ncbi:energy-coupling factor transporter transmembrane component T family protein [Haematomicrobium sanguinis]|uniref:energy-coupling factor transporter transmembrane component T family protein n=1 Tax=Haematomicrobium sanguinis TaxID=479106 RepID=UPI00047BC948|nr:energy-coupling factor transporter transmembrane protein EcfT [Haematomicrobium sanguinis]
MNTFAQLLGVYVPGRSWVHRAPLWAKFLVLLGVTVLILVVRSLWLNAVLVLVALLASRLVGVRWRVVLGPLVPVVVMMVFIGGLQWVTQGWLAAVTTVSGILAALLLTRLIPWTTPMNEILDGIVAAVRPFRRFGARPELVALTLSLVFRSIPRLLEINDSVRDAARARGLERNLRARSTPLVLETVRYAKQTGEALAARGLDDD